MTEIRGELKPGEIHPAAAGALRFVQSFKVEELCMWKEAFASTAIEGNRLAEICGETLDRIMTGKPVSDRYILGLAWTIRESKDDPTKGNGSER